jgi:hypothetical protein
MFFKLEAEADTLGGDSWGRSLERTCRNTAKEDKRGKRICSSLKRPE